jgi:gluconate 5-dehydrogenase
MATSFKNVFSLEGKTALIIGGGGLGVPIAQALMENGADIIIADLKPDHNKELKTACGANNRKYVGLSVNILEDSDVIRMVNEAKKITGRIDILVNAAGVNRLIKAEEYNTESWDFVLGINLRGVHLVTREAGKIMIEQHYGRILSISSVKSFFGTDKDYLAYCSSKGAINMYTKQLACEWGKYGITVNALAPTFTHTPINAFQLEDTVFYNDLVSEIPLGRICTTRDIGCAAVYLCSDAAEFITGHILRIDGGLTAKR